MCSATRRVGNGTKAMHISRPVLANRKRRSVRSTCAITVWWLTHMIPIVTKLTAQARYDGQMCRMLEPRSVTAPGIWVPTFRIRGGAAVANTPSANASRRAGLIAGRLGVALEIGVRLAGVAAPTVIDLLILVVREIALLGRRHRAGLPHELVAVPVEPGPEFVEHAVTLHPQRAGRSNLFQRERLELEVEDRFEGGDRVRHDLLDAHRPAELARDRGEGGVLEPAGRNPLRERRRVEVDVQCVAVRRHPLRDVDPDAGDLAGRLHPDSGQAVDPRRCNAERRERLDQRLLELAAVALHVLTVPGQVEDRVADELAGAVVGGLAAAVGFDDLDLGAVGDVQLALLGAAAERDDGRVLEQQHGVGQLAASDGVGDPTLQLPALLVADLLVQAVDVPRAAHARPPSTRPRPTTRASRAGRAGSGRPARRRRAGGRT